MGKKSLSSPVWQLFGFRLNYKGEPDSRGAVKFKYARPLCDITMSSLSTMAVKHQTQRHVRKLQIAILVVHEFIATTCKCLNLVRKLCHPPKLYLGLSQVPQSEVESPQVVEDLRGDVSLDLLLQNAGGRAVGREGALDVGLLQDLSQLDPGLNVIRVLLGYLLQMTLQNTKTLHLIDFSNSAD